MACLGGVTAVGATASRLRRRREVPTRGDVIFASGATTTRRVGVPVASTPARGRARAAPRSHAPHRDVGLCVGVIRAPARGVACRASSREDQRKDEDLKRYLRSKGVDVPPTKTPSPARSLQDPFDVVEDAVEREGFAALRLFDLDTVRERWDVPWGGWRVFLGMSGWGVSFVLSAAVFFPLLLVANGVDPRAFDASEQSKYLLSIQSIETAETFAVLWLLLRKFGPDLEGKDWFKLDPTDDPFSIEKGWLTWGLIGYAMVFLSIGVTATGVDLATHAWEAAQQGHVLDAVRGAGEGVSGGLTGGVSAGAGASAGASASGAAAGSAAGASGAAASGTAARDGGPGTIDAVLPLLGGGDGQTGRFFSVLAVTSLLAPLLEEVVFRGFLLASLTKWLPTPGAVFFSSVVFAGAHFAPRDFPQLVTLGMVLGFSYARTRNLLTPMMIHSLWNSGVLIVVSVLVSSGRTDLIPGL